MSVYILLSSIFSAVIWRVATNRKFQRIIGVWRRALPHWLEWSLFKLRSRISRLDVDKTEQEAQRFYIRTAPILFDTICDLGGYFVKIGQRFALSRGFIPEPYVDVLKPLCADVPPRPFETMAKVFLTSTGKSVHDAFESIDHEPLGSASLAQAHRAIICPRGLVERCKVVVKIMYPEVDETFKLDLDNVLYIARVMVPHLHVILQREYETHFSELDFRNEAQSLLRANRSMIRGGFSPHQVVIPRPFMAFTTRKSLVMDFLPGDTFQSVIERNVDSFAHSLGLRDAHELREHFNAMAGVKEVGSSSKNIESRRVASKHISQSTITQAKRIGEISAQIANCAVAIHNGSMLALRGIGARALVSDSFLQMRQYHKSPARELKRIFDLVVQVHGHQLLVDGFVNIDPHPGNIVILPDGRIGLIDYGQCVTFSIEERRGIARVIRALGSGDKRGAATAMRALPGGYKQENDSWQSVFKFSEFTFDKYDITPLQYDDGSFTPSDIIEVFSKHTELVVPRCVTFARRLSNTLLGTAMSFGVQTSLATSWRDLANQLDEAADQEFKLGPAEGRHHSECACVGPRCC